jgi:Domain of unknown function (DUF4382)
MKTPSLRIATATVLLSTLAACGGGSSGSSSPMPVAATASTPLLLTDAPSDNWATVGVKVVTITLTQQGGGTVTVYAPTTPATVNIAQLDQVEDLITGAIPAGTYTGATITLAANPGDVSLVVGSDPEAGFIGTPGTAIPSSEIAINGATGATGSQTVAIDLTFKNPITISSSQSTPVEIDFNLDHPAFEITSSVSGGTPMYLVSFSGGVVGERHHAKVTSIVLRHFYGAVASVATDNTSMTINRERPVVPVVSPETAVTTGETATILADATNGTLYYDLDQSPVTPTIVHDFSSVASTLPSRQVRVQARYQENGTLIATRVFVSNTFANIWISPEGHVLRVNPTTGRLVISDEKGAPLALAVDANTTFVLPNQPANTSLGTGPSFLSNVVRGFKVHVSVDPATPTLAKVVEIETAAFSGRIENATTSSFDISAGYRNVLDNYTQTLPYISASTPNGTDGSGNPVSGFKFWDFAYPTVVTTSTSTSSAVTPFLAAVGGSVGFGGSAPMLYARGLTHAVWGDSANPNGWAAPWVDLLPTHVRWAFVSNALANNQFSIVVPGGAQAVTVDVDTTPGEATLVYEVDRTGFMLSLTPEDVTTTGGLTALTQGLAVGAPVKISGIPQPDGTFKAYTIVYFGGTLPTLAF